VRAIARLLASSLLVLIAGCPAPKKEPIAPPQAAETTLEGDATAAPMAGTVAPLATAAPTQLAQPAPSAAPDAPNAAAVDEPLGRVPNLANTVATLAKDFRACYERGLETSPGMKGSVKVRVVIGPGGVVKDVTSKAVDLEPKVVACVESRLRAATFAPPEGAPTAVVIVPLSFIADAAPPAASAPPKPKSPPKKK
jgi:hypothetical protein